MHSVYDEIGCSRIDHLSVDRAPDRFNRADRAIRSFMTSSDVIHNKVASSSIDSLAYSGANRILEVAFVGGALYRYFEVPDQTFREFLSAPSKGVYFNATVRNCFRYERV
jgi:hypothetical protein